MMVWVLTMSMEVTMEMLEMGGSPSVPSPARFASKQFLIMATDRGLSFNVATDFTWISVSEVSKISNHPTLMYPILLEVTNRRPVCVQQISAYHVSDCIGSAFNVKGAMQCPNCRKIEKGQWLYANGSRSFPELGIDDWAHDEELYDLSYSEMSFGVHWCLFGSLMRLPSSFVEGEFSSTTYHDFLGQHAVFAEQPAVSSASHPCPYIAYIGPPIHPSSSNSSGSASDGYTFNSNWNPSAPSLIPASYAFPATTVHYNSWEHHSPVFSATSNRIGSPDQPPVPSISHRAVRTGSDLPRSGSSIHPFVLSHSARAGGSLAYPGSNARSPDRVQAFQAYYQQQQPSSSPAVHTPTVSRRSSGHRGLAQVVAVASSSDHSGGFYFAPSSASTRSFPNAETPPLSTRFHTWEREHVPSFSLNQADRDAGWGRLHQAARGSDPSSRPSSVWQRHGLERTSSQNRP